MYIYKYKLYIRMYLKNREKTQKKEKKLKKKKRWGGGGGACDTPSAAPPLHARHVSSRTGHPIGCQLAILVARSECDTDLSARI